MISSSEQPLDFCSDAEPMATIVAGIATVESGARLAAYTSDFGRIPNLAPGISALPTKDGGAYITRSKNRNMVWRMEASGKRYKALGYLQPKQEITDPVVVKHIDSKGNTIADEAVDFSRANEAMQSSARRMGAQSFRLMDIKDVLTIRKKKVEAENGE